MQNGVITFLLLVRIGADQFPLTVPFLFGSLGLTRFIFSLEVSDSNSPLDFPFGFFRLSQEDVISGISGH